MQNIDRNAILNEIKTELIISKEDFRNYFNERKIIHKEEYIAYLKNK
ncbi:MAG: hypothetical protein HFJ40_02350 [Clostridia bacterium]|nr:hypothetical protein [Clostridia bacterium]